MCHKNGFAINAELKQRKNQITKTKLVKIATKAGFKFGIDVNVEIGFIRKE